MTTLNIPFGNAFLPPYAATLRTLEVRHMPSNETGAVVRRLGLKPVSQVAANAWGVRVFHWGPSAPPLAQPSDAFDDLLSEAEQDCEQAPLLAAGRQWVAQAFYQGEHRTLAGLRLAAGLSQRQLGERCGLGQQHISRYESGKHKPSIDTAHEMARALGVDLETYFSAWQATAAQGHGAVKP